MKNKVENIDIEPTWESILDFALGIHKKDLYEQLRVPCQFTDAVRKLQKEGVKSVVLDLSGKNIVILVEDDKKVKE